MTLLLAPNGDILGPANFSPKVPPEATAYRLVLEQPEVVDEAGAMRSREIPLKVLDFEVGRVKHHDGKVETGLRFLTDADVIRWRVWSETACAT